MINELTDLDPLLAQYDPGKVLIGPLLNLSINSSFRFFYIAGSGGKVYESISLGFVEAEADAQRQRADIVARLESRFGEVKFLDSQLELAQAVHTLWPNDETARFLATAALEAKLKPMSVVGRNEGFDSGRDGGMPLSDRGEQVMNKTAPDSVVHVDAIDSSLTLEPSSARDQVQPTVAIPSAERTGPLRLPSAKASWPLNCDPVATRQQRHSALKDDIALAVLGLKSSTETVVRPPVEGETIAKLPVESGIMPSIMYRLCALSGAAVLFAGMIVLTSTRQIVEEVPSVSSAAQLITANRDDDSSQTAAAVTHSIPPNQIAKAKDAAPQTKPAPITAPPSPPSPAPKTARARAEAAPGSGPQSPPSPVANGQVETVTSSIAGAHPVLSQPQLPQLPAATAQVGTIHDGPQPLQPQGATPQFGAAPDMRAPEALRAQAGAPPVSELSAGPQTAAVSDGPQSPPSQMARTQAGASHVSGAPSSPSQIASAQPGEAPVSPPQPPLMKADSTATPLNADEIAALIRRSNDFLKNGDFAAARILLRRAAESGSANAALMLGKTFDPVFLRELGAIGIQPDIAQSRQWYEKAVELGSEAAAQRLANLAQTGQ
jgi:hypothetical protein